MWPPVVGSVTAMDTSRVPAATFGSHRCFCSTVPQWQMAPTGIRVAWRIAAAAAETTPTRWISTVLATCPAAIPPYSSGIVTPNQPL